MPRKREPRTPAEEAKDLVRKRAIGHAVGEHVRDWLEANFDKVAMLQTIKQQGLLIDELKAANTRYAIAYAEKTSGEEQL